MAPTERSRRGPLRRIGRWPVLGGGALVVVAVVVLLALFQPWKLWVDDKVDEAAPPGAVPITAGATSSTTSPPGVVPTTAPPNPTSTAAPTPTSEAPPSGDAPATVPSTTIPSTTVPATTVPAPAGGGAFISIDHRTTGTVVLLEDAAGTRYVRLQDLDTTNGPDLFVYLSTNPPDGPEGQFDDDHVNLGRLAGNLGSSNYEIPAGTDLRRYASVVIWCDRFDSAFGAAPLV